MKHSLCKVLSFTVISYHCCISYIVIIVILTVNLSDFLIFIMTVLLENTINICPLVSCKNDGDCCLRVY